jgi:small nuclear ribonucleoprotein (snRNP)-like protein
MAETKEESISFLKSLLNKHLRITTSDNRIFYGEFKCTDPVCFTFSNCCHDGFLCLCDC